MTRLSKTAQRIADERAAEGLLCHCGGDSEGHTLALECPTQLAAERVSTRWPEIPTATRGGHGYRPQPGTGTCPSCGARVAVKARTWRRLTARGELGATLAAAPACAPHDANRSRCPGSYAVPAETTWSGPRDLDGVRELQALGTVVETFGGRRIA